MYRFTNPPQSFAARDESMTRIANPTAADHATQPEPPNLTRFRSQNLSPYAFLGLWRNPFGELTTEERAELAVVELPKMIEHLQDIRHAIQLIGGCGFGKTTHLLALRRALDGAEYVYYPECGPRPAVPKGRPALVDEAQRMGWRQRRSLLAAGPFAIGTHVDLTSTIKRAGFRLLTIDVEAPLSSSRLATILNRRIQASRLSPNAVTGSGDDLASHSASTSLRISIRQSIGQASSIVAPMHTISEAYAGELAARFRSNLRQIEHHLYAQVQTCVREKRPWPPVT